MEVGCDVAQPLTEPLSTTQRTLKVGVLRYTFLTVSHIMLRPMCQ